MKMNSNGKIMIKCYNCGKELSKKEITREHIPAKTLFEGYDENYKVNRITVPACFDCNNKYSPTDEEFRNMIGIIAKRKTNNSITDKSIKSILRKENGLERLQFNPFGKVTGVEFCQQPIEEFHKKNFKGLFYYQYGFPLSDNYELAVNIDENDYSEFTLGVIGYLKEFFEWKNSGHKDILSYCIQPFRLGINKTDKNDLELSNNENIIAGAFIYNQEHAALVFAVRKEYLEKIKKRKTSSFHNFV